LLVQSTRAAASEQAAFAFTQKQSRDPSSITDADVRELERYFGHD